MTPEREAELRAKHHPGPTYSWGGPFCEGCALPDGSAGYPDPLYEDCEVIESLDALTAERQRHSEENA